MPQITEYTNKIEGLQPTETGVQAAAQAGRRIGASYNQEAADQERVGKQGAQGYGSAVHAAGEVALDFARHDDVSKLSAQSSVLLQNATQQWDERVKNADPNDPTTAPKFLEETLGPALDKFKASAITDHGQKFAEAHANAVQNHFVTKTTADMATAAKVAIKNNLNQTVIADSNTAYTDPSSVDTLLQMGGDKIQNVFDTSPNLKGTDYLVHKDAMTQEYGQKVVMAGAIGDIRKSANPEKTAADWIAKYPQYLSGLNADRLDAMGTRVANARERDNKAREVAQEKVVGGQQDQATWDVYQNGRKPPAQQDPNLSRESLETNPAFAGRLKDLSEARKTLDTANDHTIDPVISKKNADAVSRQIAEGTITQPRQIDAAYNATLTAQGKHAFDDVERNRLRTELKDTLDNPAINQFNKSMGEWLKRGGEQQIDRSFTGDQLSRTELGQQSVERWQTDLRRRADLLRKDGNAPQDLLDPSKPGNMVDAKALMPYRVTAAQVSAYKASQTEQDRVADRYQKDTPRVVKDLEEVKSLPPNTNFVVPEGPLKGQIRTTPKKPFWGLL